MAFSNAGQGIYKVSLESLVVSEGKGELRKIKRMWICQNNITSNLEEFSMTNFDTTTTTATK